MSDEMMVQTTKKPGSIYKAEIGGTESKGRKDRGGGREGEGNPTRSRLSCAWAL